MSISGKSRVLRNQNTKIDYDSDESDDQSVGGLAGFDDESPVSQSSTLNSGSNALPIRSTGAFGKQDSGDENSTQVGSLIGDDDTPVWMHPDDNHFAARAKLAVLIALENIKLGKREYVQALSPVQQYISVDIMNTKIHTVLNYGDIHYKELLNFANKVGTAKAPGIENEFVYCRERANCIEINDSIVKVDGKVFDFSQSPLRVAQMNVVTGESAVRLFDEDEVKWITSHTMKICVNYSKEEEHNLTVDEYVRDFALIFNKEAKLANFTLRALPKTAVVDRNYMFLGNPKIAEIYMEVGEKGNLHNRFQKFMDRVIGARLCPIVTVNGKTKIYPTQLLHYLQYNILELRVANKSSGGYPYDTVMAAITEMRKNTLIDEGFAKSSVNPYFVKSSDGIRVFEDVVEKAKHIPEFWADHGSIIERDADVLEDGTVIEAEYLAPKTLVIVGCTQGANMQVQYLKKCALSQNMVVRIADIKSSDAGIDRLDAKNAHAVEKYLENCPRPIVAHLDISNDSVSRYAADAKGNADTLEAVKIFRKFCTLVTAKASLMAPLLKTQYPVRFMKYKNEFVRGRLHAYEGIMISSHLDVSTPADQAGVLSRVSQKPEMLKIVEQVVQANVMRGLNRPMFIEDETYAKMPAPEKHKARDVKMSEINVFSLEISDIEDRILNECSNYKKDPIIPNIKELHKIKKNVSNAWLLAAKHICDEKGMNFIEFLRKSACDVDENLE